MLITILNYDKYQDPKNYESDSVSDKRATMERHYKQEGKELKKKSNGIVGHVISYLNQQTGKSFKPTSSKTQALILTREKEGFTFDNFKTVIDTKTECWGKDVRMEKYLRPETLFGTKFESYVNEKKKDTDQNFEGAI